MSGARKAEREVNILAVASVHQEEGEGSLWLSGLMFFCLLERKRSHNYYLGFLIVFVA